MSTELLGLIIITGSILAFALKYHQKQREDAKELTMSAKKLRRDLEETADGIIKRMEKNIDYLEHLLLETESHAEDLKRQIAIIRELQEQRMYVQDPRERNEDFSPVNGGDYNHHNQVYEKDYSRVIEDYSHKQEAYEKYYVPSKGAITEDVLPNERLYREENSPTQRVMKEDFSPTKRDFEEDLTVSSHDKFSNILAETLAKNEAVLPQVAEDTKEDDFIDEIYLAQRAVASVRGTDEIDDIFPSVDSKEREEALLKEEDIQIPLAEEYIEESLAKQEAKKLLQEGYSTVEISKKVHLGEGAIELLREIEAKKK